MTKDILISVFIRKEYKKALAAVDDIVSKTKKNLLYELQKIIAIA